MYECAYVCVFLRWPFFRKRNMFNRWEQTNRRAFRESERERERDWECVFICNMRVFFVCTFPFILIHCRCWRPRSTNEKLRNKLRTLKYIQCTVTGSFPYRSSIWWYLLKANSPNGTQRIYLCIYRHCMTHLVCVGGLVCVRQRNR